MKKSLEIELVYLFEHKNLEYLYITENNLVLFELKAKNIECEEEKKIIKNYCDDFVKREKKELSDKQREEEVNLIKTKSRIQLYRITEDENAHHILTYQIY